MLLQRHVGLLLPYLLLGGVPAVLAAQECRDAAAARPLVSGVVVDSVTRVPLQDAEVRLTWTERDGRERAYAMDSDSAGRFQLCRLPVGALLLLRAEHAGAGPLRQLRLEAAESTAIELEAVTVHSELRGLVRRAADNGAVATAAVRVLDTPLQTVTDAQGEFEFPKIPPGRYRVQIAMLGYGERTDTVTVDRRATVILKATLAPAPVRLPPLTVDVRSHDLAGVGFYDRRERGHGAFLTRVQWERRMPVRASDLLRGVPGVRVVPARGGFETVVLDRHGCAMRYVLDNVRLDPSFQLDQISASWIEALEIYRGPSEVPPQFMAPSSTERAHCGVIVIWGRRE